MRRHFDLPCVDLNIHKPAKRKMEAKVEENLHLYLQFRDRNIGGKKDQGIFKPQDHPENTALVGAALQLRAGTSRTGCPNKHEAA